MHLSCSETFRYRSRNRIKAERTCLWNSRHQQIPGLGSRKISQRSEDSLNPDLILYFVLLMCYGSTGLGFCETCFHVGNSCFPSIHASSDDAKSSITRRNIIETLPCNHSFGSIHWFLSLVVAVKKVSVLKFTFLPTVVEYTNWLVYQWQIQIFKKNSRWIHFKLCSNLK